MDRIRKLILLTVGVALLSGLAVSTAEAAKFTASKAGLTLAEETLEEHEFVVTGSDLDCEAVEFKGTTPATEYVQQTVEPTYSECDISSINATVITVGCKYVFEAGSGRLYLTSCNNGGIIFDVNTFFGKCRVLIPNQTIEKAVSYTSTVGSLDITMNATTVVAEVVTSTGICPLSLGKHSNVPFRGESRVVASGGTIGHDV